MGFTHTNPLSLFHQLQKSSSKVSEFLLSDALKAYGRLHDAEKGKQAHGRILKHGFNRDIFLMTSLLSMYSNCSCTQEACQVFEEMPHRDVISTNGMITALCRCGRTTDAVKLFCEMTQRDVGSWNSLISGLAQNSKGGRALVFFERMRLAGVKADLTTMVTVISVCADLAALISGKIIHGLVIKQGFTRHVPIGNVILDMYSKTGSMADACLCFDTMQFRNLVSWTSLIVGYGKHGLGLNALKAFDQMELEGFVPNEITFVGILSACSHAGLVEEGWRMFNTMIHKYSMTPMMEHYTCMVDLLARAHQFEEAHDFIKTMPINPDAKLWTAFLSSCVLYMNTTLTRSIGDKVLQLKPQPGAYILLSNFYGRIGDWEGVMRVRKLMLDRGIRKENAQTWIEINRRVHVFESGDRSHPLWKEIDNRLEDLILRMKASGYVPNTSVVVQNVEEHVKEEILRGHSEKLAIGLGLIRTPSATRIIIVKNLRVCVDCHVAIGFISKIEAREIVARDANRFHRFNDGICSCNNLW